MECRRTLALSGGGGWWNEDAMEWKVREERTPETECIGMEEATARLSGFILMECLEEVARGKGVTEWNEQNRLAAWSGLSRCMEGLAIFCIFFQHKKYSMGCICQHTESNVRLLRNEMREHACIRCWGCCRNIMEAATARHAKCRRTSFYQNDAVARLLNIMCLCDSHYQACKWAWHGCA